MPAVPLDFRSICGTFLPAHTLKTKMAGYDVDLDQEILDLRGSVKKKCLGLILPIICISMTILRFNSLLLCGDVEENPGPGPNQYDQQFSEINGKLEIIINGMNKQSEKLNEQNLMLQKQAARMETYEQGQKEIRQEIDVLKQEISDLRDQNEKHEQYSRRKNIRLYDVPEPSRENAEKTVCTILEEYFPGNNLQIERAHRVGKRRKPNEKPRPLICRFLDWRDAMIVMKDRETRETMKANGINVAQDLTQKQFEQLRSLKEEGKRGYFYRGKMFEKEFPVISKDNTHSNSNSPASTNQNSRNNNLQFRESSATNEKSQPQNGPDPRIIDIQSEFERQRNINSMKRSEQQTSVHTLNKQKASAIPTYSKHTASKGQSSLKDGPITRSRQPLIHEALTETPATTGTPLPKVTKAGDNNKSRPNDEKNSVRSQTFQADSDAPEDQGDTFQDADDHSVWG